MADEKLGATLQRSVLAALCFDVGHGAAIAGQVSPQHFDSVYRDFSAQVLLFRKRFGRPPGLTYIDDIAERVSLGKKDSLVRTELVPALKMEAEGLNAEYVLTRVDDFIQRQTFKGALTEGIDRYAQDDDGLVEDLRRIFHGALKSRQSTMDAGLFITDQRALRHISGGPEDFIPLGIPELDRRRIGLVPKEMILYLGPKGTGKTWACVHACRSTVMQRLNAVHYSLEMDEEKNARRYFQSFFGASEHPDRYNRTILEFDQIGRLSGFHTKHVKPKFDLSDPSVVKALQERMNHKLGLRIGRLVIKQFPTGRATVDTIINHLDFLAEVHGFVPHTMVVDYPKLLKPADSKNIRISIGRNVEELRGVCVERNMAGFFPHQGTRATIGAKRVTSREAGEDISVVQTADTVLSFSRTKAEEERNLGRLYVEHARSAKGGLQILLSQAYDIGQYVLSSALMQKAYWDKMNVEVEDGSDED